MTMMLGSVREWPGVESKTDVWETCGMAKFYVPAVGDLVLLEGVASRLAVVSVDAAKKTATVSIPSTPGGV
jgi:hypothetical protein